MKSHYVALWLLVSVALSIFMLVSFSEDISVGSWNVKKAPFRDMLLAESFDSDAIVGFVEDDVKDESGKVAMMPVDSTSKSILLIGDSMTFNLALQLARYARQNGHELHAVNWDSSNTKIWADCDSLRNLIARFNVDYVFISLGSNELYYKKPEVRLPYVRRILDVIDTIPYVWIGPPNWDDSDNGFNDMLASTCRRGSFFRTAGMSLARKKDKIHPTRAASAIWIDSLMRWMPESSHPIVMDVPSDSLGKVKTNIIFWKALNK